MIKSLRGQNYQSHRDTYIELSPGVNFFTGQSDSGKSSIFRMLKWVATNRPLGESFVSWGSSKDETEVEIALDDATVIHTPGGYSLIKGKDRQDWSAVGTGVPETIMQALNLSTLSFQSQMDSPFLLSSSPGEVARTLNEVADLDKIDSTLVNINRMARDNRSQLTETASRKQQLEIELSQYRGLDGQLKMIALLKEQERKAGTLEDIIIRGCDDLQEVALLYDHLAPIKRIADKGNELAILMSMERKAEGLESLVEKGESIRTEIAHLRVRLERVKDTADSEAMLDGLLDMVGQLKGAEGDIDRMGNRLADLADTKMALQTMTGNLKRLEIKWHEQFPKICPLCGK
jgi:hypothetical protein